MTKEPTSDKRDIRAVFGEALERTDPAERCHYLEEVCGSDDVLRRAVEELLEVERAPAEFLPSNPQDRGSSQLCTSNTDRDSPAESPGTLIGRYKLLEQIGEGGFGMVYMAEQEEPVRRKVALKIIKLGMDTRQVIARFEAERQALAMMDHPNMAKVLDAGATETGRPYFVMELVRGIPITTFCEENRLSIKERLQLFIPVCQAIQHAHQKGVIHRDIKPSNVLVTMNEGVPHPMVIDFGVAKAINQRLTEKTFYTRFAQMIGTPAYMSPEQAEMSKQDVDTRTDVYSLGILLYELLTGTTPFPEERLRGAGYAEIQRIISQEEPVRPSTLLSRLNGRSRTVAASRRREPASLMKLIKGDLDWIVLKAIDKDRNRRYETTSSLAADLQRYLSDEPVTATPPSVLYRLSKFVKRNKAAALAGTAVLTSMLAGLLLALVGFSGETRERRRAEIERNHADQKAAEADAAADFLIRDLLGPADVWLTEAHASPNRDVRLLEIVDRASTKITGRFRAQPLVEARIRMTLGGVYSGLGEIDQAERHLRESKRIFEQAAGPDDPRTLEVNHALAVLLRVNRAALDEAEVLLREVVETRTRILGLDHVDTLNSMIELAWVRNVRVAHAEAEGMFRAAATRAEQALEASHPIALRAREGIVATLWDRGERDAATQLISEILETRQREQGRSHPDTLQTLAATVFYLREHERDFPRLDDLINEGLESSRPVFGDHGPTADLELQRSVLLNHRGLHAASLALREQLWRNAIKNAGPAHPLTTLARFYIGWHHVWYGMETQALEIFQETLSAWRASAPDSYSMQRCLEASAQLHWSLGRRNEALALQRKSLEINRRVYGPESANTRSRARELAEFHARAGEFDEAGTLFRELAEMPTPKPADLIRAALTTVLSDDRKSAERWLKMALEQTVEVQNTNEILRGVLITLLMENTAPAASLKMAEGLAKDRSLKSEAGEALEFISDSLMQGSPLDREYLATFSALLAQEWPTAWLHLEKVVAGASSAYDRTLAGFLLAGALAQEREKEIAEQKYSSANVLLHQLAQPGDLGDHWIQVAVCVLAQRWAANLIFGIEPSPAFDAALLADERQRWLPVKKQLDKAFRDARSRRWQEAAAAIHAAMTMPEFAWETVESSIPRWSLKLAVVFARAEDLAAYRQVCAENQWDPALLPDAVKPISLFPLWTRGDAAATFLVDAEGLAFGAEYGDERHVPEWPTLIAGLSEFQAGDLESASMSLARARGAYNLHCAAIALAYGAQVELLRAERATGEQLLQKAKSILGQLQQNQLGDLGRLWFELALVELAVSQAEAALATAVNYEGRPDPVHSSTLSGVEAHEPQKPL